MNLVKFRRTPFLQNTTGGLLQIFSNILNYRLDIIIEISWSLVNYSLSKFLYQDLPFQKVQQETQVATEWGTSTTKR